MRLIALLSGLLLSMTACARGDGVPVAPAGSLQLQEVARGLEHPWALAFLPDGRMLVTERPGRMRLVDAQGRLSPPLAGVPAVADGGQGGLLDVVLDPQFAQTRRIYFSYSEPRADGRGTAVAHAQLGAQGLEGLRVIFRQQPSMSGGNHYGSRLAFAPDGNLFVTLGERYNGMQQAQLLDNHLGKVIRIDREGGVPVGNPYIKRKDARPEIWSYGHRNPQGAAIDPQSGRLWTHEHGPRGGDEINLPQAGRNYGWPVITWGVDYSGLKIADGETTRKGMEQPLHYWVPSIAPSGMAFYTAQRFPAWRGSLFVGSLKFGQLVRLQLDGERVLREERHELGARIRDVRQGPDGWLYLLTDDSKGRLLRVGPATPP
ncbi:MAG TPA: PQQ-dependent sugar dehydrogenase [Solimonas sp.]|nr:PQQ-dependent sugar dehydrogenase [Solimonas sp.]